MVAAFTTAAVINHSMARPEKGVIPLDFMPNHKHRVEHTPQTDEQLQEMSDFNLRVLIEATKLKAKKPIA